MKPLGDVYVLDMSWHGPGAFTTWLLADLGADVVKIEPVDGSDFSRTFPPQVDGVSIAHLALNRGKQSVAIDLRDPRGREAVRAMARSADAVVEGFRPGVASRLGLGAEELRSENAALTYCHLGGYPTHSRYRDTAGHDLNYVARAGVLSVSPTPADEPMPTQVADYLAASLAAFGTLAGVLHARRTGEGRVVDASLYEAARFSITLPLAEHIAAGRRPAGGSRETLTGSMACYGLYECSDGERLTVAALEPKFWRRLCELLGVPELISQQFAPDSQPQIRARLADVFATRSLQEWLDLLADEDVCVAEVRSVDKVAEDLRSHPEEFVDVMVGPSGTRIPLPAAPLHVLGNDGDRAAIAPTLGEHTRQALERAGLVEGEIDELFDCGAVR